MGKWIHRLSDLDAESRSATCANCGPVDVQRKGDRWACAEQRRADRRKYNKKPHGLTVEQAASFRAGKSCEICGSSDSLKVDHDHQSGEIRGVLCHHCNVAIGHMRDDPDRLRRAAEYLEK